MRWPWVSRIKDETDGEKEARAELARLHQQRLEVKRLAEIGRVQQERNHLGEGIERAMRRRYAS